MRFFYPVAVIRCDAGLARKLGAKALCQFSGKEDQKVIRIITRAGELFWPLQPGANTR